MSAAADVAMGRRVNWFRRYIRPHPIPALEVSVMPDVLDDERMKVIGKAVEQARQRVRGSVTPWVLLPNELEEYAQAIVVGFALVGAELVDEHGKATQTGQLAGATVALLVQAAYRCGLESPRNGRAA